MKTELNFPKMRFLTVEVFLSIALSFTTASTSAEEWRNCEVVNSVANEKEAAIAFGKIEKRLSFFKKTDFASVTIFLDGKTWNSAGLIKTGRRLYGDGKPYQGYTDKTNSLVVQEFEDSDLMIVRLRGDVDFTMFAKCH